MGEVIEFTKKHWTGLDADLASVPNPALFDTYGATDSKKLYYWNGTAWKTGLGYELVERLTNGPDFAGANPTGAGVDFTTDGNWKVDGLDLSAIVPAGAIAVKLKIYVVDDAADTYFTIRRDAAHGENIIETKIHVANITNTKVEDVSIDSNRLLDYKGSNVTFAYLSVTVLGWFI